MREIKFRVWHKPTNKYVTMSQEDWSYGKGPVKYKNSGDFLAISHDGFLCHEGYGNGADNVEDSENYVVQQYTGLKDKNGVEIYEGDILLDKNGAKYSVFWHDTDVEFSLSIMNEDEVDDFLISLCWRNVSKFHLEIVGNIFEGVDK